jgi:hypothetical protein
MCHGGAEAIYKISKNVSYPFHPFKKLLDTPQYIKNEFHNPPLPTLIIYPGKIIKV